MKNRIFQIALGLIVFASMNAFADLDNAWILRCISDNKDMAQPTAVVEEYCRCMDKFIESPETASHLAWQKTHKAESDTCSKASGWK